MYNNNYMLDRLTRQKEEIDNLMKVYQSPPMNVFNKLLTIKELNGDIKEYKIEIPKTQEQLENEELKDRVKELERKLKERNKNNEY